MLRLVGGYLTLVLVLMALENRIVFRPGGRYHEPPQGFLQEDVWLTTSDEILLHAWFCPCPDVYPPTTGPDRPVVLYCHGTFGELTWRAKIAQRWQESLGADVLLFDYRGYGLSEGRPTEAGLYRDSRAAYDWLTGQRGVDPRNIVLVGRSLGGPVAAELAAAVDHRALVLESTFTSLPNLSSPYFPGIPVRSVMRNQFPTAFYVGQHDRPLFVSHGSRDGLIPVGHARRLYQLAPGPKQMMILADQDHIEMPGPEYYRTVGEFLASQP